MIYGLWKTFSLSDLFDILAVAWIFYMVLVLIRGTRGEYLLKGLVFLLLLRTVAELFGLYCLEWLIQGSMAAGLIALVIIFQPELRRALEELGRTDPYELVPFLKEEGSEGGMDRLDKMCAEIAKAAVDMASRRLGALMVLRRSCGLEDVLDGGVPLDAALSSELLQSIFTPPGPLHDGAVVIGPDGRVERAACFLPLARDVEQAFGSRHRAALGLSENTDAVIVVVSEETGGVSIVAGGRMDKDIEKGKVARRLRAVLSGEAGR